MKNESSQAKRTKNEEVYIGVIKELVKEKNKWEMRAKHPLKGWSYGDEHPRISEVIAIVDYE